MFWFPWSCPLGAGGARLSGELSIVELELGQDPEPGKGGGLVREHHQHREGEEETKTGNLRGVPSVRDPQKGGELEDQ